MVLVTCFPALGTGYISVSRLDSGYIFPALDSGYIFSRAWHRLHQCFPAIGTGQMFLLTSSSDWLISLFVDVVTGFMLNEKSLAMENILFIVPIRSRPIVEMEGKIILSTTQISLEDNKTMRLASDSVSRKRYFNIL